MIGSGGRTILAASRCGKAGIEVRLPGMGEDISQGNKDTTHHITINLSGRSVKAGVDVRLQV